MKPKRGFSVIELIIAFALIVILAGVGVTIVVAVLQHAVYSPKKLNMDFIAQSALDKVIDGDNLAKGLRFSQKITAADANSITFTDSNGKSVTIALSSNKITRTINSVADSTFLYQAAASDIIEAGRNGSLFLYFDAINNQLSLPVTVADIRRVEINLIVRTGAGAFGNWQGRSEKSSSVFVPKYQL